MIEMVGLAALSGAANLASGLGSQQAAAKRGRLQQMEDAKTEQRNRDHLDLVNAHRQALGRELLTIPQTDSVREGVDTSTDNYSYVDVEGMMAAADKAGFNPVTWLNAGGLGAYTQTGSRASSRSFSDRIQTGHNASDAFKMMIPEYFLAQPSQVAPQSSVLQAVGGAGTAALSTFTDLYKSQNAITSKENMFNRQMETILKGAGSAYGGGLSGGTSGSMVTMGGPTGVSGGLRYVPPKRSGGDELATSIAYPEAWERGDVSVTNPNNQWRVDKFSADAQNWEDRYGELGGEIGGITNSVGDSVVQWTGKPLRDWGRTFGMNPGDYPGDTKWEKVKNWWNGPEQFGPWQYQQ